MGHDADLNRRTFLQQAGMTALWGAVGTGTAAASAGGGSAAASAQARFDFDEVYNLSLIHTDAADE